MVLLQEKNLIVQINRAKPQRNSKICYAGETLPDAFTARLGLSSHFHIPPDPGSGSFHPPEAKPGWDQGSSLRSGPAGKGSAGGSVPSVPRDAWWWWWHFLLGPASAGVDFCICPWSAYTVAFCWSLVTQFFCSLLPWFPQLLPLNGLGRSHWPSPGAEMAKTPQDINRVSL